MSSIQEEIGGTHAAAGLIDSDNNDGVSGSAIIRCAHVNLNRSMSGVNLLSKLMVERRVDIAFVQEPNIRGGRVRGFSSSFDVFYKMGGGPKVAVVVKTGGAKGILLTHLSSERVVVVEILKGEVRFFGIKLQGMGGGAREGSGRTRTRGKGDHRCGY